MLATSSAASSQIMQQQPSKSLTSKYDDDIKYESDDEPQQQQQQKVQMQVQATKSKLSQTLPTEDAKEVEVESETDYALEPESQLEEPSYSQQSSQEVDEDSLSELYYKEMESALENVRKLAYYHQESLVDSICEKFADYNGEEASVNDIAAVFRRMKLEFAKEAEEPLSDSDDDENDSDYDPNDVTDRVQVQQDLNEDYFSEVDSVSDTESDADDSDYIGNNFEDLHQGALDNEEDVFDSDEPILIDDTFAVELDESEVIDSETFDAEYFDAIKCAQSAAKLDAAKIIEGITSDYVSEYEEDALADVISRVFEGIAEAQTDELEASVEKEAESKDNEVESESEVESVESVDADDFQLEMDSALENVRQLASYHQQEFVAKISDLFLLYNGCEPSVDDLSDMFAGIKQEFADEAAEEILEEVDADIVSAYPDSESEEEEEEESDSDYSPEAAAEDIEFAEQDEEDDENIEEYLKADDATAVV